MTDEQPTPKSRRREGRKALFELPAQDAEEAQAIASPPGSEGRSAMFSSDRRRPGTVVVDCSSCHGRSRVSFLELPRLFALSITVPFRSHPHRVQCPSCRHWTWCRIEPFA